MFPIKRSILNATDKQKAIIHKLASKLFLSKDNYRDMLKSITGYDSCTNLSVAQASLVIEKLNELLSQSNREIFITSKQINYIKFNWLSVDYEAGNNGDTHLNSFLLRRFGVNSVEELTRKQASGVVSAIRAIQRKEGTYRTSSIIEVGGSRAVVVHTPDGGKMMCQIKEDKYGGN